MLGRLARFLTHQLITKRMAIGEVDVVRAAQELIREHGTQAAIEAETRIAELRATGDDDRAAVWARIAKAARGILERPPGAVN